MTLPQYVTIDGTNYATEKLSPSAREQVANLQIVEDEIRRLSNLLGIAQTAKNVYVSQLINAMQSAKAAPAEVVAEAAAGAKAAAEAPPVETVAKKPRAAKKSAA